MSASNGWQVPDGWTVKKIEEVAEVNPRLNKDSIPNDLQVFFVPMPAVGAGDGTIDLSRERPFSEVKKGFTPFREGDVLFAKITPCMENGKMAVVPKLNNGYGFGSTEFHVLRPKDGMDPRYLYYYVSNKSFRAEAEHHMSGAVGQKRVPTTYLKECKIPVAPPEQQVYIVAEIEKQFSRLDEAVANLKRVKANLKRYKAAVLKVAVEGKLTEEWRKSHPDVKPASELLKRILTERRAGWEQVELAKLQAKGKARKDDTSKKRYPEPAAADTNDLPKLPEGWVWAKTDQIFWFVTSGSRGWAEYYSEIGPLFLRIGNLDHDSISIDFDDLQRVSPPEGTEGTRTRVVPGDILVSITADVGMIAMVPGDIEEAYINQHISLARPVSSLNRTFLAWYLCSKKGQDQFKELQRGATKAGLGLNDIRAVNVPLPPLAEQDAIVQEIDRRFSLTEELEAQADANLKRAERLRQSILRKAFAGELTRRAEKVEEPDLATG